MKGINNKSALVFYCYKITTKNLALENITHLLAYHSLGQKVGEVVWFLCTRLHYTKIKVSAGSAESASNLSQVISRIQLLVVTKPAFPFSCWLLVWNLSSKPPAFPLQIPPSIFKLPTMCPVLLLNLSIHPVASP